MREWVDGWIGGWVGSTLSGLQPLLNVLLRDIICVMITKKEQQNIYCWFLAVRVRVTHTMESKCNKE